jgi:hypothetical protein
LKEKEERRCNRSLFMFDDFGYTRTDLFSIMDPTCDVPSLLRFQTGLSCITIKESNLIIIPLVCAILYWTGNLVLYHSTMGSTFFKRSIGPGKPFG